MRTVITIEGGTVSSLSINNRSWGRSFSFINGTKNWGEQNFVEARGLIKRRVEGAVWIEIILFFFNNIPNAITTQCGLLIESCHPKTKS